MRELWILWLMRVMKLVFVSSSLGINVEAEIIGAKDEREWGRKNEEKEKGREEKKVNGG
jgi:hypothetical protein